MRCDVMLWNDVCSRGARMLKSMVKAAATVGVDCQLVDKAPSAPLAMTWGLGHTGRRVHLDRHLKAGGRVIAWDLGYWDRGSREDGDQSYRVTIDHDHPWRLVNPEDPARFDGAGIALREDANPNGPILVASMGRKSAVLFPSWQKDAIGKLRKRGVIQIRGKSKVGEPIESALKGKSLVVCRHSNVAIDACIAGVPVECSDGIAYALYRNNSHPTREQRLEFLRTVAHWQYKPTESVEAWKFLLKVLSSTSGPAAEGQKVSSIAT